MNQNKMVFEILGYRSKIEFNIHYSHIISEYETRANAKKRAEREIKQDVWYAVKYQSEDREEIEILYS